MLDAGDITINQSRRNNTHFNSVSVCDVCLRILQTLWDLHAHTNTHIVVARRLSCVAHERIGA